MDSFYDEHNGYTKSLMDSLGGGSFLKKLVKEAFELLDDLALILNHGLLKNKNNVKLINIMELKVFSSLVYKLNKLSYQVASLNSHMSNSSKQNNDDYHLEDLIASFNIQIKGQCNQDKAIFEAIKKHWIV